MSYGGKARHTHTHTMHELKVGKFTSKISRHVCILVQSSGQPWSQIWQAACFHSVHCLCHRSRQPHLRRKQSPGGWTPPFWAGFERVQLSWKSSCLYARKRVYSSCLSCRNPDLVPGCGRGDVHPSPQSQQGLPSSLSDNNKPFQQLKHIDGKRKREETSCCFRALSGNCPSWQGGKVGLVVWSSNHSYWCLNILGK